METLEIQVYDTISTFDTLIQGIEFVVETIKKWFETDIKEPLNISIRKGVNKAPPSLSIDVNDRIKSQSGLV
jgi:hypothetical protein